MSIADAVKETFMGHAELKNLRDLFLNGLKDMYFAEKSLKKALTDMAEYACSTELSAAFESHREETIGHIERLEKVFQMMDEKPQTETCEATKGLLKEGEEIMDNAQDETMDAGLVYAARAVEHYEISRYSSLISWADKLGMDDASKLLKQTLKEEQAAEAKLTKLADDGINEVALTGDMRLYSRNPSRATPSRPKTAKSGTHAHAKH